MGAQKELYIKQMNDAREEAYRKIDYAMQNLIVLDVSETEILSTVHCIYERMHTLKLLCKDGVI